MADDDRPLTDVQRSALKLMYGPGIETAADLRVVLGQRLQLAREINGMDGATVARMIGHANGTQLSLWERGARMPPLLPIVMLSAIYDVPTDYLLCLTAESDRDTRVAARMQVAKSVLSRVDAAVNSIVDAVYVEIQAAQPIREGWEAMLPALVELTEATARFRELNAESFIDMRGGARLVAAIEGIADVVADLPRRAAGDPEMKKAVEAAVLRIRQ